MTDTVEASADTQQVQSLAPSLEFTKKDLVEHLINNIEQFNQLKNTVIKAFVANNINVEKYSGKLKNAKHEFSKDLFRKKLKRFKKDSLELLLKADQIDNSIKNIQGTISKVLTPEDPVAPETVVSETDDVV